MSLSVPNQLLTRPYTQQNQSSMRGQSCCITLVFSLDFSVTMSIYVGFYDLPNSFIFVVASRLERESLGKPQRYETVQNSGEGEIALMAKIKLHQRVLI